MKARNATATTTPAEKLIPLQVMLPPELHEQVLDMAAAESRSNSSMGRILIVEALAARTTDTH